MQLAPPVDRITRGDGGARGGLHGTAVVADHEVVGARQQRVTRLEGFLDLSGDPAFEAVADRFRRAAPKSSTFEHPYGLGESRWIGGGRSRADSRKIVLRHVG